MMKKLSSLLLVFLLVFAPSILASPKLTVTTYEASSWPKLVFEVEVDDLATPSFSLKAFNQVWPAYETAMLERANEKVNVLFCVDISGSVAYNFESMQKQLTAIANLFSSKIDTYSMIAFAHEINTLMEFSNNPAEAGLIMGKLAAMGSITRLNDVIIEADKLLKTRNGKGVIFLLSDGVDDGSQNQPTKPDFPVVTVAPPGGVNAAYLRKLSEDTGGLYMPEFVLSKLQSFVATLKGTRGRGYRVIFDGLPEVEKPSTIEIELSATISSQIYTLPIKIEVVGSRSLFWIWLLVALMTVVVAIFVGLWTQRYRVRGGRKTIKKSSKGGVHYIAWISLYGLDTEHYRIRKSQVTIGTSKETDFFVDDPTVSFEHCQVNETDDGFMLKDLQSVGGTFVNDVMIEGPTLLKDGDRIRIGNTVIQFTQSDFAYVSKKKVI